MSRELYEENIKVYWLTACSNIAAPTTAEIAAGTNMTPFVCKDGVAFNITENDADTASIDTDFDSKIGGSWGAGPTVKMFRDGTTETNGFALCVKGTNGFLVVTYFGAAVATSKCAVFPCEMGQPTLENSAANEAQKFTERFHVTSEPNLKAVVA